MIERAPALPTPEVPAGPRISSLSLALPPRAGWSVECGFCSALRLQRALGALERKRGKDR